MFYYISVVFLWEYWLVKVHYYPKMQFIEFTKLVGEVYESIVLDWNCSGSLWGVWLWTFELAHSKLICFSYMISAYIMVLELKIIAWLMQFYLSSLQHIHLNITKCSDFILDWETESSKTEKLWELHKSFIS